MIPKWGRLQAFAKLGSSAAIFLITPTHSSMAWFVVAHKKTHEIVGFAKAWRRERIVNQTLQRLLFQLFRFFPSP